MLDLFNEGFFFILGEVDMPVAKKPKLEPGALPNLSLPSSLG